MIDNEQHLVSVVSGRKTLSPLEVLQNEYEERKREDWLKKQLGDLVAKMHIRSLILNQLTQDCIWQKNFSI